MALTTNFTDASTMATDHAAHHNALAVKLNNLGSLPRITGWYYDSAMCSYASAAGPCPLDMVFYTPFLVDVGFTANRIGVEVTTAGTATIALGIYNDTGACAPGTLLLGAGTVTDASTGFKEITINQALAGGALYWLACHGSVGFAVRCIPSTAVLALGFPSSGTTNARTYYIQNLTYTGTLPNPAGTLSPSGGGTGQLPSVKLRAA